MSTILAMDPWKIVGWFLVIVGAIVLAFFLGALLGALLIRMVKPVAILAYVKISRFLQRDERLIVPVADQMWKRYTTRGYRRWERYDLYVVRVEKNSAVVYALERYSSHPIHLQVSFEEWKAMLAKDIYILAK